MYYTNSMSYDVRYKLVLQEIKFCTTFFLHRTSWTRSTFGRTASAIASHSWCMPLKVTCYHCCTVLVSVPSITQSSSVDTFKLVSLWSESMNAFSLELNKSFESCTSRYVYTLTVMLHIQFIVPWESLSILSSVMLNLYVFETKNYIGFSKWTRAVVWLYTQSLWHCFMWGIQHPV